MGRRAAKIDANHAEVVSALRKCGWFVKSTAAMGDGFPDAICCRGDVLRLVEIKGAKGTLTPKQKMFHAAWPVTILRSIDDALELR
jgi:Holliday junction resolvase